MYEPRGHYAKLNKPAAKDKCSMIPHKRYLKSSNSWKQKVKWLLLTNEERQKWEVLFNGYSFSLQDEKVLETYYTTIDCATRKCTNCSLKMLRW